MMILHSTIQSFQHQHIYIVFAQGCHLMNPNVQMWCWWLSNVLLQRLKKENSFLFLHMSNLAYGSLFVHRGPKIYVSLCYKIFWQITYYKWHFSQVSLRFIIMISYIPQMDPLYVISFVLLHLCWNCYWQQLYKDCGNQ